MQSRVRPLFLSPLEWIVAILLVLVGGGAIYRYAGGSRRIENAAQAAASTFMRVEEAQNRYHVENATFASDLSVLPNILLPRDSELAIASANARGYHAVLTFENGVTCDLRVDQLQRAPLSCTRSGRKG